MGCLVQGVDGLIRVEVAVPVTSPAYDLGEGEPSIRARWLTYWTRLWSRM